ncbi:MAG: sulfatase-like hydrolase/transferase, partial [Planctomycetota bacterium]
MTSRRVTAARVAFATWLVAACSAPAPSPLPAARRPNVVVFLVDDLGTQETSVPFQAEASALNKVYRTPAVERLAAEGVKFPQAYASAVCSPTRISLLTGMNVARHGVTNWTLRRDASPDDAHPTLLPPEWHVNGLTVPARPQARAVAATPLPALLRDAGYRTIHVGKAHFGAIGTPGADP